MSEPPDHPAPSQPEPEPAWWARPGDADPWRPPAYEAPRSWAAPSPQPPTQMSSAWGTGWPAGPSGTATAPGGFGAAPVDTLGRAPRPARRLGPAGLAALVLAGALVGGGAGGVTGYVLADREASATLDGASLGATAKGSVERPEGSTAAVAAQLLPRVVSISVSAGSGRGTGSGFIIRSDGYILTNNHVVSGAAAAGGGITVTFHDERDAPARVVGRDSSSDLAVLKVGARSLPVVEWADSDAVVVGDPVIAIGSPLGLSGTVTTGIVSATNRPVSAGDEQAQEYSYISAIQTDAAINPGNSGGPLVDARGRVIGVNSVIAQVSASQRAGSIGVGFAIPSKQAKRTAEQLIITGRASHPVIGVSIDPGYTGPGARIAAVTSGGPAEDAGLQPGDVVTAIGDDRISNAEELIVKIRANQPGDRITLSYLRAGDPPAQRATLTLVSSEK